MTSKRSSSKKTLETARIDDLKLINGIGQTVEKRLRDDGIYSFVQLAAFLPGDVAAKLRGLPGMSAKRIIREDWIGQARKLAEITTLSEAHKDFEPAAVSSVPSEYPQVTTFTAKESESIKVQKELENPEDSELVDRLQVPVEQKPPIPLTHIVTPWVEPQKDTETMASKEKFHPATFTIELQLDENKEVHSVRVVHAESQREHSWTGWPSTQLLDYLSESVELHIPLDEPALAESEKPEQVPAQITASEPHTSPVTQRSLTGTLHLRDMKIQIAGGTEPRRLLPHDQPFDVRLTLDLSECIVPDRKSLDYKVVIYRKTRSDPSGQIVVETEGTIEPAENVTIDVAGNILEVGSYLLAAKVILALPGTKPTSQASCIAEIEGGRVRIY